MDLQLDLLSCQSQLVRVTRTKRILYVLIHFLQQPESI